MDQQSDPLRLELRLGQHDGRLGLVLLVVQLGFRLALGPIEFRQLGFGTGRLGNSG